MASPNPKPTNLKKLEGTYRKDRAAKNEMKVKGCNTMPPPPAYFSEEAKKVWYTTTEELSVLKMLNTVDLKVLEAYCYQAGVMNEAAEKMEIGGKTTMMQNKGGGVYEIVSPWWKIYKESSEMVNKLAQQFGFTPSARTKINTPAPEEEKDPLDKLLNS